MVPPRPRVKKLNGSFTEPALNQEISLQEDFSKERPILRASLRTQSRRIGGFHWATSLPFLAFGFQFIPVV